MNPVLSRLVSPAVLCAGLFMTFLDQASGQEPDLVALSVQGPDSAQVGGFAFVNTFIVNLGGPLTGTIDFEILLSEDLVIDASDVVVTQISTGFVGALNNAVTIPDLPPGKYNWALRVSQTTDEVVTFNNEIVGGQTNLFEIDLCLDSTKAVSASAFKGATNPADHVIEVSNCGSGGSIMIFTATFDPPAPWLKVTPGTSFAVAGGTGQPVSLKFDVTGLEVGEYATQVLFQNFNKPSDFEIVPVTLTIGEARFVPGDTLLGEIEEGDVDEALFDAVKGMTLSIKFTTTFGNLKPTIDIIDDQNATVKSWKLKSGANKIKKSVKLKKTGTYRLRVTSRKQSLGAYEITTKRNLPKKAEPLVTKATADDSLTADVKVLSLADATLALVVDPTKKHTGTVDVSVYDPSGLPVDIGAFVTSTKSGGIALSGLPLPDLGAYIVRVGGFGAAGEKVKVTTDPTQPAPGAAIVIVP